ncbi:hypothetical protein, partial [Streptococcus dysgalactiae]|uniref:hypothetical protein n=1 Tax=Streptococcus dysgalactiae TaxID=1334 RepID=UPI001CF1F3B9
LKVIISRPIVITIVKEKTSWINIPVCLQSERLPQGSLFKCSSFRSLDCNRVKLLTNCLTRGLDV